MLSANDTFAVIALVYAITALVIAHMRYSTERLKIEQRNNEKENRQYRDY